MTVAESKYTRSQHHHFHYFRDPFFVEAELGEDSGRVDGAAYRRPEADHASEDARDYAGTTDIFLCTDFIIQSN